MKGRKKRKVNINLLSHNYIKFKIYNFMLQIKKESSNKRSLILLYLGAQNRKKKLK